MLWYIDCYMVNLELSFVFGLQVFMNPYADYISGHYHADTRLV